MGFAQLDSDYGLHVLKDGDEVKLLLTRPSTYGACTDIAAALRETFEPTTMGTGHLLEPRSRLIGRADNLFTVSDSMCWRFHLEKCNGCVTPEATTLSKADVPATSEHLPYVDLVGYLQYLVMISRPGIAHATRHLGKDLADYNRTHFTQAKRVLRYLKTTCDYGLAMDVQLQNEVRICAYSDADYANDSVDRRSINGYSLRSFDLNFDDGKLPVSSRICAMKRPGSLQLVDAHFPL
ncbi:hypothetical protein PC128_g7009 [Phytophthora cactorum]|nr:hypothetical protein PC120_g4269 [Phytophthora cactorum]KAG3197231.1 hypothetical protein PC128_g7009 [Phytophthora cactorum]